MIVVIEHQGERAVFANVTNIEEIKKPSVLTGERLVVNIFSGDEVLMGGDAIDLSNTTITLLPNAEKDY